MKRYIFSKSIGSFIFFIFFSCSFALSGQNSKADTLFLKSTIGFKAGLNFPSLNYSNSALNEYKNSLFPRGLLGAYFEVPFTKNFSFRPELTFIGKGQKIDDLGVKYTMKSNYLDLRFPLLYTFHGEKFSPYLFVGPTMGFAAGGNISLDGYSTKISKSNIAPFNLGVIGGLGVKVPFLLSGIPFTLSGEAAYTYGLSDTYAKNEKNGTAIALNKDTYSITGTRKNRGIEINFSLAIPIQKILSVFNNKKNKSIIEKKIEVAEEKPQSIISQLILPAKDCYTIEEMITYLKAGKDMNNKKICLYTINFETNKSNLDKSSISYLEQIVTLLNNFPNIKMTINGHTDNVGTEEYNIQLSKRRALAVYDYMVSRKINKERLKYAFYGTSLPVATNDSDEGKAENRRVEFEVKYDYNRSIKR